MINAITIFISAKVSLEGIELPKFIIRIICSMGACCFGIYLWHILVYSYFQLWNLSTWLKSIGMNSMIAAWIMCLVTMLISYVITLAMSKVPILKKLVGF